MISKILKGNMVFTKKKKKKFERKYRIDVKIILNNHFLDKNINL